MQTLFVITIGLDFPRTIAKDIFPWRQHYFTCIWTCNFLYLNSAEFSFGQGKASFCVEFMQNNPLSTNQVADDRQWWKIDSLKF